MARYAVRADHYDTVKVGNVFYVSLPPVEDYDLSIMIKRSNCQNCGENIEEIVISSEYMRISSGCISDHVVVVEAVSGDAAWFTIETFLDDVVTIVRKNHETTYLIPEDE